MRLSRIQLRHAPGLPGPIHLDGLAPGLNLVVGPNASGKSTIRRAVHASLWPDEANRCELVGAWTDGHRSWRVTLLHGHVAWSPDPPVLPVASSARAYVLTMRDLLRAGGADHAIARELRVELSGGYDLHAARSAFDPHGRAPRALVQAVKHARAALARAEGDVDDLGRREEDLRRLRGDAEAARRAADALRRVELAEERWTLRERREATVVERRRLPEAAGRVDGHELRRFDELAEEERAERERAGRARRDLEAARRRRAELAFEHDEPATEEVEAWRARLEALRQVAGRLEHARREATASAARARELETGVFGDERPSGRVDPALLDAIEDLAERHRTLAAAERAGRADLRLLERLLEGLPADDPERIASRAHLLRSWLALAEATVEPAAKPPPEAATGGDPGPDRGALVRRLAWAAFVLGAVAALIGAVTGAWPAVALGALLLGAGAGLLVAHLQAGRHDAAHRDAAQRFAEGVSAAMARLREEIARGGEPPAWSVDPVREHLVAVERRLADARLAERARLQLDDARRDARAHASELEERATDLARRVAALGIARDLAGLPLAVQARRILQLVDARADHAEREQRLLELEQEHTEALSRLDAWLTRHGSAPCRDVADAAARLEALAARRAELVRARDDERRHAEATREATERADSARQRSLVCLERAGVADRAGLAEAVRHRAPFVELSESIRACEVRIAEIEPRIGELASLDRAALAKRRAELEARAESYEGLIEQIKSVEVAIEAATGGRTLEDARAALAEAQGALLAARDASWEEAVALWLADRVEGEQGEAHAPPVLKRARAWFARFTRGAFELELDRDVFAARDTRTGELRALHELSDATRIQLLLAARVAHVESLERGGPELPLFLDEVLSTTDPGRFRAIAATLLELAADGRQLVYLTADFDEVAAWSEACREVGCAPPRVFDLGDAGAVRPPSELPALAPRPTPPRPDDHDADSYARALGVQRPDGHGPVSAWHLWYLLRDDLPSLHRCLTAGLTTVGQWASVQRHGAALLPGETASRLRRRVRLLDELLERWRLGRARPLTWDDVLAAGVVTPAFEDDLRTLAARHAHDPAAFLAAVADLPRFRRAKLEELEAHLREQELLPDDPPLTPAVLEAELAVQAAVLGEPDVAWVGWLVRVLAPGAGEGAPTGTASTALT